MTDLELLRQYSRDRSDDAFAELLRRHVDWVYSTCRGLQVSYLLAIPEKHVPHDFCQLPVTAASADELLTVVHVPYSAQSGHDDHFAVTLRAPIKPNPPTLRDFAAREYDETIPLVGLVANQTEIGPRTDAGISTKEECLAEMEKQIAKSVSEKQTPAK